MVDRKEDPPPEDGYFHGSVNGQFKVLRDALAPLARIAHAIPTDVSGDAKLVVWVEGVNGELDCNVTVADARAAIAALRHGRPVSRETLKAGGAKEVGPTGLLPDGKKGSNI